MKIEPMEQPSRGRGPSQQVVKQAIHWLLRLRNHAANPILRQQCDAWRIPHHDHELAWQRV